MGADTGAVKIHMVRNVKQKRSANCLRIPAKRFYLSELQKVHRSGVISRSLARCCPCKSSVKHFIYFTHRKSLRLAIRVTREEAGEQVAMQKNRLLWHSSVGRG